MTKRHPVRVLVGAVLLLASVAASAGADMPWDAPHAANPILPGYYADPCVLEHEGHFYIYATLDPWGGETLGCWESSDFKNWTFKALNWPTKAACTTPASSGAMVWAPSVVRAPDGTFHLFVSVGSEVWTGVAVHPLGPWCDANGGRPLIPRDWNRTYHMIDAEAFIDDDGSAYLYWGSGWNWTNGACFAVKLASDLVTFEGEPRNVTPPGGHYFEGPIMFRRGGRYYLMYSDGVTIKDTYRVHYAIGGTPFGPFREPTGEPILETDAARHIVSPGHHGLFRSGDRVYIVYHRQQVPYVEGQAFRQTCIDELRFAEDGLIEKVLPTHAGPPIVQDRLAGRINLAAAEAGARMTSSSDAGELHTAARAADDNYATRWAAASDADGAWLQVDFGAVRPIARTEIWFEYAWKRHAFAIEASDDGESWRTLTDCRDDPVMGSPIVITMPATCWFLRLAFPTAMKGADISVIEWGVFAE